MTALLFLAFTWKMVMSCVSWIYLPILVVDNSRNREGTFAIRMFSSLGKVFSLLGIILYFRSLSGSTDFLLRESSDIDTSKSCSFFE